MESGSRRELECKDCLVIECKFSGGVGEIGGLGLRKCLLVLVFWGVLNQCCVGFGGSAEAERNGVCRIIEIIHKKQASDE